MQVMGISEKHQILYGIATPNMGLIITYGVLFIFLTNNSTFTYLHHVMVVISVL